MEVNEKTEIRKLLPKHRGELARILEDSDTWKKLMGIIPKTLHSKDNFEINDELRKYNSEHFRIIENESRKGTRLCSEILFEEWGCSGHIRPSLGHLLYLLKKAELYRAADYVARNILNKEVPTRPSHGPPAPIEFHTSEIKKIEAPTEYRKHILYDISNSNKIQPMIPKIVIDDPPASSNGIGNIPNFDALLNASGSLGNIPSLRSQTELSQVSDSQPNIIPPLSDLLLADSSGVDEVSENYIPNLTPFNLLMKTASNSSIHSSLSEDAMPDFSALKKTSDNLSFRIPTRSDVSPLPSLPLNTSLPHYSYAELEIATNNFDETPYENTVDSEVDPARPNGRFLGSGAFGSVFLGLHLMEVPVAVKRINLKDLNIVKADDFITKQFKNEVEILWRYKHENLLSLIGYSCDGLTYCLLYEYVPGGNLKDRLENTKEELVWTQRLHIAMGTARGVSYLHTAYASPLIHRDIKSANILLDATNKPKLCDFGIVRLSSPTTTGTSQIFGTSAYMPPEAHRGDVSVKMDTFSFGVVLLELITGLPPIDYNRPGNDLVTHVQDCLDESDDSEDITPLLDTKAGSWILNGLNFANELYKISGKCLQEKKNMRPIMTDITEELSKLLKRS